MVFWASKSKTKQANIIVVLVHYNITGENVLNHDEKSNTSQTTFDFHQ